MLGADVVVALVENEGKEENDVKFENEGNLCPANKNALGLKPKICHRKIFTVYFYHAKEQENMYFHFTQN